MRAVLADSRNVLRQDLVERKEGGVYFLSGGLFYFAYSSCVIYWRIFEGKHGTRQHLFFFTPSLFLALFRLPSGVPHHASRGGFREGGGKKM